MVCFRAETAHKIDCDGYDELSVEINELGTEMKIWSRKPGPMPFGKCMVLTLFGAELVRVVELPSRTELITIDLPPKQHTEFVIRLFFN